MRKTKIEKGITLVALIITIVVLMILAAVTIGTIQNTNIVNHAIDAGTKYNGAQANEQGVLGGYEGYLNSQGNGVNDEIGIEVTEGDTVRLDSDGDGNEEDWIVLTATEGLVEIVSADARGSLTLGSEDTSVKVTTDLDGDETEGNDRDIAIASYNNAITTINNYCKSLVKEELKSKVRSVGSSTDTSGEYSSTDFNKWFKNSSKVKVKAGDELYKTDLEKMQKLGIASTSEEEYWLASRAVDVGSDYVSFQMRVVYEGELDIQYLWEVYSDSDGSDSSISLGVRLVITNPTGFQAKK